MSVDVEFKTKVAKQRRIHVPKALFQIKEGDDVIVRIEKLASV